MQVQNFTLNLVGEPVCCGESSAYGGKPAVSDVEASPEGSFPDA